MSTARPLYLPLAYQDAPDHGRLILRDGSTATIRLSQRSDLADVRAFYARLSPQSRRMRFFSESKPGEDVMLTLCDSADPQRGMTLLVWRYADGAPRIIASGSYIAHNATTAEFAVAVDDAFQGKGLGGLILERLSVLAASHGFLHFSAFTHINNHQMLEVFRHSGFHPREQFQDGLVEVTFSLLPGKESVSHAERRDRLFTKASIRPFFAPATVAVIGASRDPANLGHRLFMTLLRQPFRGVVYPVNPLAAQVSGVKAYPTIADVPEPVDLAVIAVPRDEVDGVVDRCAERGVRALIVISTGFAETGPEGKTRQDALLEKVRGYGMRLLGPNCLGLINTDPDIQLNASLFAGRPARGKVAISSQSGALGMALLQLAGKRRLGLSMFVSMGNKADVTGNDLLYYWEDDPSTDVILLYLESFGNPRRFGRIAREVSRRKPIVCVKSGRRHASPGEQAVDALFRQTGVIRVPSLEEMFDVAALLGTQPLPAGPRIAVVSNSHGASVLCEDAAAAGELAVTKRTDLGSEDSPEAYRHGVAAAMADESVDAVVAILIPLAPLDLEGHLAAIAAAIGQAPPAKPVLLVTTAAEDSSAVLTAGDTRLPCYLFPETAMQALAAAHRYRSWREAPPGMIPDYEDVDLARIRSHLQEGPEPATNALLRAAQLPVSETAPANDGVAVEVEVHQDPVFGPVVSFSLAGYHREILGDVSYRMAPLTDEEARGMIRGIRGFPILERQGADLAALEDLILRLSFLVEQIPEIDRVRLAPVMVRPHGGGCHIAGATVHRDSR